jgi:hypothetical protein
MEWTDLGGSLTSNAAAASWGEYETQVFAIHDDGGLWNRYWDGSSWHAWESLGGSFTGQPAASARAADRIDVMAVGADGVIHHRYWNGSEWVPWHELAGSPRDAVGVTCSWIGDRLDVFATAAHGSLWYLAVSP